MSAHDLEVRDVHFGYGSVRALQGVNLRATGGETTAIIGANGAGKSTLMKVVAGVMLSQAGSISFGATTGVESMPAYERVRDLGIVLVPEGRGILGRMTVDENLAIAESVIRKSPRYEDSLKRDDVMGLFPVLGERRQLHAGSLSGGEQQMLSLARALLMNPTCLLLDEPSMGLAPRLVEAIFASLEEYKQERALTIVLVEQNTEVALDVSSHAYVLERGQVVLQGSPQEISLSDQLREAYLGL